MKLISQTAIFSLFMCVVLQAHLYAADTGMIKVAITGLRDGKGPARIALVNNEESFIKDDAAYFMAAVEEVKDGTAEHVFAKVPYGTYAVKFFQDGNGSGKLDYGLFGIPKEKYGFSNNVRSKSFDKAKFSLDRNELTISIVAR